MKKKLIAILVMITILCGIASAQSVSYKGFLEVHTGYLGMGNADKSRGLPFGVSTSHGIELWDSFFVGLGADGTLAWYRTTFNIMPPFEESHTKDYTGRFIVGFVDIRYNFCKEKSWHPFIGMKGGAGYRGHRKQSCGIFFTVIRSKLEYHKKIRIRFRSIIFSLYIVAVR